MCLCLCRYWSKNTVAQVVNVLEEKDAICIQLLFQQVQMILLHYNILLHSGAALAEYFMYNGKATLVIMMI
jgi:F0F1-type ATP synthase alpha subunit